MSQKILSFKNYKILVLEDHESTLIGTISVLEQEYPKAKIFSAQTAQIALAHVKQYQLDLIVMDLSIPERCGDKAQLSVGIELLKTLMQIRPTLNIVVQSAKIQSLVRLKPIIDLHEAGFAIVDKNLMTEEMLKRAEWALQGLIFTPREMRMGLELKPEWLEILRLAFQEGLQDKAIAKRMNISERTVRNYWTKVQDALGVYPEDGKNIRIQTEIQAREAGLID